MNRKPVLVVAFVLLGLLLAAPASAQDSTVSPESLDFGQIFAGNRKTLDFTFTQRDFAQATVTATSDSSPFFVFFSNVPVDFGESVAIDVDFEPFSTGNFVGTIRVNVFDATPMLSAEDSGPVQRRQEVLTVSVSGSAVFTVPSEIDFGGVPVGQRASRTIEFSAPPEAQFVELLIDDPAFGVTPPSATFSGMGGETATATVSFRPTSSGPFDGTLRLRAFEEFVFAEVQLVGQGISPFEVSPTELDFGDVLISNTRTLRVRVDNNGQERLTVGTNFAVSGPFSVSPETLDLEGGGSGFFDVTFAPQEPGEATATMVVSGANASVAVSMRGMGAGFLLSEEELDLGAALDGCTTTGEFTITPYGPLDVTFSVPDSRFSVIPSQATISEPATIQVVFTSDGSGLAETAVRITARPQGASAGSPADTQELPVHATGVTAAAVPEQLSFGAVEVGRQVEQVLSIVPLPEAMIDIEVVSASVDDPAFEVGDTSDPSAIPVAFRPPAEGEFSATLELQVVSAADPECVQLVMVPLQGQGVPGELTLNPASLSFGGVPAGASVSQQVTVASTSEAAFDVTATSGNEAFRVEPSSFTVPPMGSANVEVFFEPAAEGPVQGAIVFSADRQGSAAVRAQTSGPETIELTLPVDGTGLPQLSLRPESMDFGLVAVGSASAPQQGSVVNESSVSFSVTASPSDPAFQVSPQSFTVPASGSASFDVTFTPAAEGPQSGTITFTASSTGEDGTQVTLRLAVSGEGEARMLTYQVIEEDTAREILEGDSIEFDATRLGSNSSVVLEIRNTGDGGVTLSNISSGGSPFSLSGLPGFPLTLAPGSSASFDVVFEPQSLGTNSGALNVDQSSFPLTGVGLLEDAPVITGLEGGLNPPDVNTVGVELSLPAPQELTGVLSFSLTPESGLPADPMALFETGGGTASFVIPEGETSAVFGGAAGVGFQPGTIAATFDFEGFLDVDGVNISPEPVTATVQVELGPPVIENVTVERSGATITILVTGFSTPREITGATFTFTANAGVDLQTPTISPEGIQAAFESWYGDRLDESIEFGSLFALEQEFTVSGDASLLQSVSVTLTNGQGTSNSVSANIP